MMADDDRYPQRRRRRRRLAFSLTSLASTSLLLLGLLLGLGFGLYYAWILEPVSFTEVSPGRLEEDLRRDYLYLISQGFAVDGNVARARQRLTSLGATDMANLVAAELALYVRTGRSAADVANMAHLAAALGVQNETVALFAPTAVSLALTPTAPPVSSATPTLLPTPSLTRPPTATPTATQTPFPSATPTATPPPVYRLLAQERLCFPAGEAPLIEVNVLNAFLDPLPGVAVVVEWDGGRDQFFTGFKPAGGPGYADFIMALDTSYRVSLPAGSPTISGLRAEPCLDGGPDDLSGWQLTFQNLIIPTETPESDGG
ncbi:MAG: hypothetical protein KDE09_10065 [Anaerolineales bacterium]|nr:hypothetical protein [Anaerolineales bacterium]MCB8961084.1 hypothetical protein [Ardenticatenales bacterium]